jgi:O-antigen/teichoic acid export membrane protein
VCLTPTRGGLGALDMNPDPTMASAPPRYGATRLYRDAGSMAFASLGAAVFGAAFWVLAAKLYPPDQIGVMTAVLAVINAVGIVVASAAGDAYTTLLPAVGSARLRVYKRGRRRHWILSYIAGIGSAVVVISLLSEVRGSIAVGVLVAVGIVVWSTFYLQFSTLIALGHARWAPVANIAVSFGRIALLPVFAITIKWHSVELAFISSAMIVVAIFWHPISRFVHAPYEVSDPAPISEEQALKEYDRLSAQMVLNAILGIGITVLTPFLVTVFSNPTEGALFALCFTLAQLIDFVTGAMCWSLVVHAANQPQQSGAMARAVLVRTLGVATVASVLLILTVPIALPHLNSQYGEMRTLGVIAALCLSTVIRVFYIVWAELQRSRRKMREPLLASAAGVIVLFALMPGLSSTYGALGGAVAMVALRATSSCGAAVFAVVARRRG